MHDSGSSPIEHYPVNSSLPRNAHQGISAGNDRHRCGTAVDGQHWARSTAHRFPRLESPTLSSLRLRRKVLNTSTKGITRLHRQTKAKGSNQDWQTHRGFIRNGYETCLPKCSSGGASRPERMLASPCIQAITPKKPGKALSSGPRSTGCHQNIRLVAYRLTL